MKNLTDYIAEAYEYNYNISNVPKYTSTGTDKVDINKKNNRDINDILDKNNEINEDYQNWFIEQYGKTEENSEQK